MRIPLLATLALATVLQAAEPTALFDYDKTAPLDLKEVGVETRGDAVVTVTDRMSGVSRTDGKLSFVDNTVDPTTGTITLKAMFANGDHALWPGQFVQVQTRIGLDREAIVVPSSAVQVGQNGAQVFVVKPDQTVELRAVKVIRSAGDTSLLADGVNPGETVVTDGQLRLVPGAKVEFKTLENAVKAAAGKPAAE